LVVLFEYLKMHGTTNPKKNLFPVWKLFPSRFFHWAEKDETPEGRQKCVKFGGK
jgi:hypothetical protein